MPRNRLPPADALAHQRGAANNIPAARTVLLARETVIAEIAQMLEDSRLVTLTGAGGIGKADGVWLVELASLANSSYVAAAIAQALDVRELVQSSPARLSSAPFSKPRRIAGIPQHR
jgi:hypothetical protein